MTHLIYGEDTLVVPFLIEGRSSGPVVARMSRLQARDRPGTRGGVGPQAQAVVGGGEPAEGGID